MPGMAERDSEQDGAEQHSVHRIARRITEADLPLIPSESISYATAVFAARRKLMSSVETALREAMWMRGFMLAPYGVWSRPHLGNAEVDNDAFVLAQRSGRVCDPEEAFLSVFRALWRTRPPGEAHWYWPGKRSVFFARRHGVQRPRVMSLDAGVGLFVKSLALVGVSTWSSCDGHHLLTGQVRTTVKPARIWICDADCAAWLAMLVEAVRPVLHLRSEFRIDALGEILVVEGQASDPLERAWEQDRDLNNLGRLFAIVPFSDFVRLLKEGAKSRKALHAMLGPVSDKVRRAAEEFVQRDPAMFID